MGAFLRHNHKTLPVSAIVFYMPIEVTMSYLYGQQWFRGPKFSGRNKTGRRYTLPVSPKSIHSASLWQPVTATRGELTGRWTCMKQIFDTSVYMSLVSNLPFSCTKVQLQYTDHYTALCNWIPDYVVLEHCIRSIHNLPRGVCSKEKWSWNGWKKLSLSTRHLNPCAKIRIVFDDLVSRNMAGNTWHWFLHYCEKPRYHQHFMLVYVHGQNQ